MSTKRILADIGELQSPIYAQSGIFYKENEENVREGYACIFGPAGTPYEDCPMLYSFKMDEGFPFDPPKVLFHTNDGITRFHPNMYKEGKVCLSILHTWEGPKWASTMRLSTILITLQSLLDTNPILHEPGYTRPSEEMKTGYIQFIENSCIQYILERAQKIVDNKLIGSRTLNTLQPDAFIPFEQHFQERLPSILERLERRLSARIQEGDKTFTALPYQLQGRTQYAKLLECVVKLKAKQYTSYV